MTKVYTDNTIIKYIGLIINAIALFWLVKLIYSLENENINLLIILYIMFSSISFILLLIILDTLFEKITLTEYKFIQKRIYKTKELHFSNVKGFTIDKTHIIIYSKDDTIILVLEEKLKYKKEKLTDYLFDNFEYIEEEE